MIDEATLGRIEESMTDADRMRLLRLRDGCTCFISPPCSNCVNPLTEEEAEELGLLPAEPKPELVYEVFRTDKPDPESAIKAVRDMCRETR